MHALAGRRSLAILDAEKGSACTRPSQLVLGRTGVGSFVDTPRCRMLRTLLPLLPLLPMPTDDTGGRKTSTDSRKGHAVYNASNTLYESYYFEARLLGCHRLRVLSLHSTRFRLQTKIMSIDSLHLPTMRCPPPL